MNTPPRPWRLTLDTNPEDCNANCIMCEEHSPHSTYIEDNYKKWGTRRRRMPEAWLEGIFEQAKGLGIQEIIPSTMGEPLIYPHFEKLLELCWKHGFQLNLTTNGSFPRKSVEEWAEQIAPITSDVKFSWNGATAETYEKVMAGLRFQNSVDNLKRFIAVRDRTAENGGNYCRVTLQLTFLTNAMHELPGIIQLAARLGADRVKGHHLWVHWDDVRHLGYKHNLETRKEWNRLVALAQQAAEENPRKDGKPVLLEGFYPLAEEEAAPRQVPTEWECPFLGTELWVAPDGRINPCCAPDEQRQTLGYFGQVPQTSLSEAMASGEYRSLLNSYKQHPVCQSCNMRKPVA